MFERLIANDQALLVRLEKASMEVSCISSLLVKHGIWNRRFCYRPTRDHSELGRGDSDASPESRQSDKTQNCECLIILIMSLVL